MNFLNRRMFQEGGGANQEYAVLTDGSTKYYDPTNFEQQLRSLSESEIFALQNSANSGQISFSPGLQSILNQVINRKQIPAFEDDPSVDTTYSSPLLGRDAVQNTQSYKSIGGDFGRVAKGIYGPVLSSLVRNVMPKESLDDSTSFGIPGIGGASLKSIAEYDSPFFGEGVRGFEEAGARGGRSKEELDAILSAGLQTIPGQQIQDFQSEIDEVDRSLAQEIMPKISGLDLDLYSTQNQNFLRENPGITPEEVGFRPINYRDEFGELAPITAPSRSDFNSFEDNINPTAVSQDLDSLSEDRISLKRKQDAESRRANYEQAMVGKDEFGFPVDRPTRPLSITDFSDELKDLKPINVLKTEIESKEEMQEKFLPDLKPTLTNVDTSITQKEADAINKKEQEERDDPVTTISNKPGFFGSDNFLNFIRNVGGELVRTGQFGEGLASGAAKAAEERAARELMADQEERKYSKEMELAIAKAKATYTPDIMKIKDTAEYNEKVKRDITDFEGGLAGVGFVDYAIEIIEEAQDNEEPVGGVRGLFAKLVDKGFAFANMGRDFDDLSADSKVDELTRVVKQKNLQAILGESGRTISDKDREIIERVFGDLDVFKDPNVTLGLLRESRRGLAASNAERYSRLTSNAELISRQGPEGARFYQQLLPSLQRILNIDPYGNQSAIAKARFAGRDPNAGIQEIGLGG